MIIELSSEEVTALREKLEWLMREANGVDIWLSPGEDNGSECFLDVDEQAHHSLLTVLEKLK